MLQNYFFYSKKIFWKWQYSTFFFGNDALVHTTTVLLINLYVYFWETLFRHFSEKAMLDIRVQ